MNNNIIICSKNRSKKNLTSSTVDVILDTPLKCGENEYFTVKINSFNMIKSFYSIQTGLNSVFIIILKNNFETNEYLRSITSGNYNVALLLQELKKQAFGLVNVEYNRILNKFKFSRDENNNTAGYDLYIKCVNCGSVLGFENDKEILITTDYILSDTFVNISGYSSLLIKLENLSITNSYVNLIDTKYSINKMIGIVDISAIAPMDSIIYSNNNQYKISDRIISNFSINIVNEDNVEFPQISDYILNLSFERHTYPVDINVLFNTFMLRFNDLMFYISYLLQYLGIAP